MGEAASALLGEAASRRFEKARPVPLTLALLGKAASALLGEAASRRFMVMEC